MHDFLFDRFAEKRKQTNNKIIFDYLIGKQRGHRYTEAPGDISVIQSSIRAYLRLPFTFRGGLRLTDVAPLSYITDNQIPISN